MPREKLPRGWARPERDLHYEFGPLHLVVRREFGGERYTALVEIRGEYNIISERHPTVQDAIDSAQAYARQFAKRLLRRLEAGDGD